MRSRRTEGFIESDAYAIASRQRDHQSGRRCGRAEARGSWSNARPRDWRPLMRRTASEPYRARPWPGPERPARGGGTGLSRPRTLPSAPASPGGAERVRASRRGGEPPEAERQTRGSVALSALHVPTPPAAAPDAPNRAWRSPRADRASSREDALSAPYAISAASAE